MSVNALREFRRKFRIDARADLRDVSVAVNSIYQAFAIASGHLEHIDPGSDSGLGFRLHTLINLLGRNFEHAQAMLVSLATGSPASSEALARIVVEGSVNLTYLAVRGHSGTHIHFFREWLQGHRKKLAAWRTEVEGMPDASWVLSMIAERNQLVDSLTAYVDRLEEHLGLQGVADVPDWPKSLFMRFEALGRQADYYTSYHRLSGASHITAEDTLGYLISLEMPDATKRQLGVEAWAYSTMMTRIAATFFVDAAAACVISNGRTDNEDLKECKLTLAKAAEEVSTKAGVPKGRADA
ncbi:MAG: DUF5677 domain-containing protein [Burkholderiaceae bacterium]